MNASQRGIRETAQIFQINSKVVQYWKKKKETPNFHSNSHGGAR